MLNTISKENFQQLLGRFSTNELENLLQKFPYFQQAHLLLAKKYQQEDNPKFDEQLQLAALYAQDKELFFSLFHEKTTQLPFESSMADNFSLNPVVVTSTETNNTVSTDEISPNETTTETQLDSPEIETVQATEVVLPFTAGQTEIAKEEIQEVPSINLAEPRTFDQWLSVMNSSATSKVLFKQEELPQDAAKQDEELEKLLLSNLPAGYMHQMMEEETHYSKGLDKFIEEQKIKHKQEDKNTLRNVSETEMAPELITETMAKVYEMQKKYTKAIRAYEVLTLKYPEKSDLFAARINYLKNII